MVQIFKDTYEDLTPETFEKLIDGYAAGRPVKPGPQNGRQFSAPEGGLTTLTDTALYGKDRTFTRIEPPPARHRLQHRLPPLHRRRMPRSLPSCGTRDGARREVADRRSRPPKRPSRSPRRAKADATATPEKAPSRVAEAKPKSRSCGLRREPAAPKAGRAKKPAASPNS